MKKEKIYFKKNKWNKRRRTNKKLESFLSKNKLKFSSNKSNRIRRRNEIIYNYFLNKFNKKKYMIKE